MGDSAVRSVYDKSQLVIWAVEGLSLLVAASISEDRYGVVQKDLPKVFEALLTLQQTVERHRKGSTATARKNRFETQDLQLKQELRVALKSSLFRICVAFGGISSMSSFDNKSSSAPFLLLLPSLRVSIVSDKKVHKIK